MAERKQVNKYYPPDFDPRKHKNLDKYHNSHALRERAKKIDQGILVIRFEMPYDIWCEGCKIHIAMGVRYNAEKRKVGYYYSTPIYRFRMKCHLCENYFEIETDPKNVNYKIMFGAQRKNERWDMAENEQVLTEDRQVVKKLASDAMFKLEHGVEDKKKLQKVAPTLSEIADIQSGWQDDYMQNRMLRNKFRKEKKELKEEALKDQALLDKSSLDIDLVPETEEDRRLASLLKYEAVETSDEKQRKKRLEIQNQSIFASPNPKMSQSSSPNAEKASTSSSSLDKLTRQLDMAKKASPAGFGIFDVDGRKRKTASNVSGLIVKKRKSREGAVEPHHHSTTRHVKHEDGRVGEACDGAVSIVERPKRSNYGETCDRGTIDAGDSTGDCLDDRVPGSTNGTTCYSESLDTETKLSNSQNPAMEKCITKTEPLSGCDAGVTGGTAPEDSSSITASDVKTDEIDTTKNLDRRKGYRDANETDTSVSERSKQAQENSTVSLVGDYATSSSDPSDSE